MKFDGGEYRNRTGVHGFARVRNYLPLNDKAFRLNAFTIGT
jgi:hypothetical protein